MTTTTKILTGYNSQDNAYEVKDYPYGFRLRTSIFYWIESKAGKGDRLCTYTINPKNGRPNKPKCSTYATFMYLYLDEKGYVQHKAIDSYHLEEFAASFEVLLNRIGETNFNSIQQQNIRINHYQHLKVSAPYVVVKYSEALKPVYIDWLKKTLNHIKTCKFSELTDYPLAPVQDNPSGQVKMTVTTYETDKPREETPTHTITVEKVTDIIKKVLPGFYVNVSEHKQTFGGNYLSIAMAASGHNINNVGGQKVQIVSLSLDLKTLELQTQIFGGNGGGCIYREPNKQDEKERFLAMKSVKIPFRRPACNETDVLNAIERFAVNYKNTLIENRAVLMYQNLVNYDELLNPQTV